MTVTLSGRVIAPDSARVTRKARIVAFPAGDRLLVGAEQSSYVVDLPKDLPPGEAPLSPGEAPPAARPAGK